MQFLLLTHFFKGKTINIFYPFHTGISGRMNNNVKNNISL